MHGYDDISLDDEDVDPTDSWTMTAAVDMEPIMNLRPDGDVWDGSLPVAFVASIVRESIAELDDLAGRGMVPDLARIIMVSSFITARRLLAELGGCTIGSPPPQD